MRSSVVSLAVILAMLAACRSAVSAEPAEAAAEPLAIPDVKSLADLEASPAIDVGLGWSVRLGVADPGEAAGGPWLVLYCLVDVKPDKPRDGGAAVVGEPIGPASYEWAIHRPGIVEMKELKTLRMVGVRPGLFCATLPITEKNGERVLTVFAPGERIIARRSFERRTGPPRPCYWYTFAALRRTGSGDAERQDFVVADDARAAYPLFGPAPMHPPATDGELPGAGAPGDADGLRLSLEDGTFVIAADRLMTYAPDELVLARWWVNDEPVVEGVREHRKMKDQAIQLVNTKEMRIAFGLPDHLPALNPGDRIALQVLYAPGGHRHVLPPGVVAAQMQKAQRMMGKDDVARPLLSNRLEFELTDERLAKAGRQK